MFTKWLQAAFKVPLVVQLTDDEKCLWRCAPLAKRTHWPIDFEPSVRPQQGCESS